MATTPVDPLSFANRDAAVRAAFQAARKAAGRAGVVIREIEKLDELAEASRVLSSVREATFPVVSTDLLRALSRTGNYVAGSFRDGVLIGASVGFFAFPPLKTVHSHITGVLGATGDRPVRGVGYALKLHQRAWTLERGVSTITWTFDPLVRRNAHFNITKLGARAVEYLPNFYGEMTDGVNAGEDSDRLFVSWPLLGPEVQALCDGDAPGPAAPGGGDHVLRIAPDGAPRLAPWCGARAVVAVPADVERMRVEAPALAHEWRLALRDALAGAMAHGARVVAFRRAEGYVIDAADGAP